MGSRRHVETPNPGPCKQMLRGTWLIDSTNPARNGRIFPVFSHSAFSTSPLFSRNRGR